MGYTLLLAAGTPRPAWPSGFLPPSRRGRVRRHAGLAEIARDLRATTCIRLYFWAVAAWRWVGGRGLFGVRLLSVGFSVWRWSWWRDRAVRAQSAGRRGSADCGVLRLRLHRRDRAGFRTRAGVVAGGVWLAVRGEGRVVEMEVDAELVKTPPLEGRGLGGGVGAPGKIRAIFGSDPSPPPRSALRPKPTRGGGDPPFSPPPPLLRPLPRRRDAQQLPGGVRRRCRPALAAPRPRALAATSVGFALFLRGSLVLPRPARQPAGRVSAVLAARQPAAPRPILRRQLFGGLPLYAPHAATAVAIPGRLAVLLAGLIALRWRRIGTPRPRLLLALAAVAPPAGLLLLGLAFNSTPSNYATSPSPRRSSGCCWRVRWRACRGAGALA